MMGHGHLTSCAIDICGFGRRYRWYGDMSIRPPIRASLSLEGSGRPLFPNRHSSWPEGEGGVGVEIYSHLVNGGRAHVRADLPLPLPPPRDSYDWSLLLLVPYRLYVY